jgi:hypothetical protein
MATTLVNLTVLIGSCDSYNSLWKPFQICFNRYWQFDTENIFVTEKLNVPNYTEMKYKSVLSDKNSWGGRMLDGLKQCKTEFVFFILEDYFFDYSYSETQMTTWLSDMKRYNINRLQISPSGHQTYNKIEGIPYEQIDKGSNYLISMQPSIWRVDFLANNLKDGYSAWDFEKSGSNIIKDKEDATFIDRSVGVVYFNAVRRGFKKSDGWDEFMNKQNIIL